MAVEALPREYKSYLASHEGIPNNYQFYEKEIDSVLQKVLNLTTDNRKVISNLPRAQPLKKNYYVSNACGNTLDEIKKAIKDIKEAPGNNSYTQYIPVCTNSRHWVYLKIEVHNSRIKSVSYNDSLHDSPERREQIINPITDFVKSALEAAFTAAPEISVNCKSTQQDNYKCGDFVIAGIVQDIANTDRAVSPDHINYASSTTVDAAFRKLIFNTLNTVYGGDITISASHTSAPPQRFFETAVKTKLETVLSKDLNIKKLELEKVPATFEYKNNEIQINPTENNELSFSTKTGNQETYKYMALTIIEMIKLDSNKDNWEVKIDTNNTAARKQLIEIFKKANIKVTNLTEAEKINRPIIEDIEENDDIKAPSLNR